VSVLKRVTATGDVATGARTLYGVALTPAAALATLDVRDSSGGTVVLSLQAAANGSSVIWQASNQRRGELAGILVGSSLHATISGAGASASFEYT
jgi:hypothetical protein